MPVKTDSDQIETVKDHALGVKKNKNNKNLLNK